MKKVNGVIVTVKLNSTETSGVLYLATYGQGKHKKFVKVAVPDCDDPHQFAMEKLVEKYNIEIASKIAYRIEDFFSLQLERVLWGFSL
jgi:hypothetical protein